MTLALALKHPLPERKKGRAFRSGLARSLVRRVVIQRGRMQETRHRKRDVHVVIGRDEEGWLVRSVPSLPGCHTQARTLEELAERTQEAAEAYLDASGGDVIISDFIGIQKTSVDRWAACPGFEQRR